MEATHRWKHAKGVDHDGDYDWWFLLDVDKVDVMIVDHRDGGWVLENGQRGYPISRRFHTLAEAKAVALELVTLDALFTDGELAAFDETYSAAIECLEYAAQCGGPLTVDERERVLDVVYEHLRAEQPGERA